MYNIHSQARVAVNLVMIHVLSGGELIQGFGSRTLCTAESCTIVLDTVQHGFDSMVNIHAPLGTFNHFLILC